MSTNDTSTDQEQADTRVHDASSPFVEKYLEIGRGSCGAIYEKPGTFEILKRDIKDFREDEDRKYDVWNEVHRHVAVYHAFKDVNFHEIHIPKLFNYTSKDNLQWWNEHSNNFPEPHNKPANIITAERILPLSLPIREGLIERYSQEKQKTIALESPKNKHALIQPTLGRLKPKRPYLAMINLRNLKLDMNQLEELGINTSNLAKAMATSLAIMHFIAKIDANDIEFIFGSAPTSIHQEVPTLSQIPDIEPSDQNLVSWPVEAYTIFDEPVYLWLIDFNMCRPLIKDKFVEQARDGFVCSAKAMFPRPRFGADWNEEGERLWRGFRVAYLDGVRRYAAAGDGDGDDGKEAVDMGLGFLKSVEDYYQRQAEGLVGRYGVDTRGVGGFED